MVKQQAITSSLMKFWQDQMTVSVTTIYPGMQVDTSSLSAWYEWRAEVWQRIVQRQQQKQLLRLNIQVHLYARETVSGMGPHELSDEARGIYTQTTVPVYDYEESGTPLIGQAMLYEPEIRELSRSDLNHGRHALRHQLIQWNGIVQEI